MKKILIYILPVMALAASCTHKPLIDSTTEAGRPVDVEVLINWEEGLNIPTDNGMRVNIFALDGDVDYGRADMPYDGGVVRLGVGTTSITYTYNYVGNNVRFRNETDPELIEATSSTMVRATYSRVFPDEPTISTVRGDMHVGINPSHTVGMSDEERIIEVWPENIITDYTYEVRGITGTQFIRAARGGISGMSASHFMAREYKLSETPSTLLFDGTVNPTQETITGGFRTFGRLDRANNFTIEILYPSKTPGGGILQQTWDVTGQIEDGGTHIIIDATGMDIPDEGGEEADGWEVDLEDWKDETIELN